jgi:phage shock protein A
MKIFTSILMAFSMIVFVSSCNSVSSRLDRIDKKMDKADANLDEFKESDWNDLDREVNELKTDMDKNPDNYVSNDRERANKLIGRYEQLKIKKAGNDVINGIKDQVNQIKGLFGADDDSTGH